MKKSNKIYLILIVFILGIFSFFFFKHEHSDDLKDKNKSLVVVFETKPQTFDPRVIGMDANTQYLEELLFLPLISFDEVGNMRNVLAQSITPQTSKSWLITLKKGVVFNSGQEITAQDVVATYNAIINTPFGFPASPRKSSFKNVAQFKELSSNEIYLELKEPDASFLNNLIIGILPKLAATSALPNNVVDKGYESGPFVLKSSSDTDVILAKNPKYNFSNLAGVDEVDFKIIKDPGTRYASLMKGDADIVQNVIDPDKIQMIEAKMNQQFHVYRRVKQATTYLGFNFKDSIVKNLKVRQAIAYAIDKKSILNFRMHSSEQPASSMFPSNNFYFNKDIPDVNFDCQKAKELLKESGLGLPLPISLKVSSSNQATTAIKAIAANLTEVGFAPKIEQLENSIFQEQIRKGNSQVWLAPWTGFKDPDHLRFVFSSDMAPPNGGNRGAYSNPQLDKLLEKGKIEFVPIERKKIYDRAQLIVSSELPYIFLWHGENVAVVSAHVQGYNVYADGRYWSLANVTKK